jgi:signal transduction histidine kinase
MPTIIVVYFFYGLAFFVLGLVLALASRQASEFKFARAIRPLAAFGIIHGIHEWFEMFQQIALLANGHTPALLEEIIRLALLGVSFVMLLAFGLVLLSPTEAKWLRRYWPILAVVGVWLLGVLAVYFVFDPLPGEALNMADVLMRYILAIPGALLAAWALMVQQRTFREHHMSEFGRDLIWSAVAIFVYGAIGQLFVRPTELPPSTIINSVLFFEWFGFPVQLFRGVMAVAVAVFMVRALRAFEQEQQERLERANEERLKAQKAALESEHSFGLEMEHLNEELRLKAHELSLLLDLSNLLAAPMSLQEHIRKVLERIIETIDFADAGMILLVDQETEIVSVPASTGFSNTEGPKVKLSRFSLAFDLGQRCVIKKIATCRHTDGKVIEFSIDQALKTQHCRQHQSPATMIGFPLTIQEETIGSIVLVSPRTQEKNLSLDELKLIVGIAQQLELSVENARLYQDAQKRETVLANLLHQVVDAQEAERQRIARELHDATAQSLTAIALGLRGLETLVDRGVPVNVEQVRDLKLFGTNALGELRQIIADLRPPQLDDLGLVAALQWYVQSFEKRYAIPVSFVIDGKPRRLPSEYETVLFRITQEALTNVSKHAKASRVIVSLDIFPFQICLSIEDDGCGFDLTAVFSEDAEQTAWGLLGIKERAALLGADHEIYAAPGKGTYIRVSVPLIGEKNSVKNTAVIG